MNTTKFSGKSSQSSPGRMEFASNMLPLYLADRVRYFKSTEEGVSVMCKAMEDMRNETARKEREAIAIRMLENGKLTHEEIAECAGLTLDQVKELAREKSA